MQSHAGGIDNRWRGSFRGRAWARCGTKIVTRVAQVLFLRYPRGFGLHGMASAVGSPVGRQSTPTMSLAADHPRTKPRVAATAFVGLI